MTEASAPKVSIQIPTEQEPLLPPLTVNDLDEPDQGEELQPRKKRGRIEASSVQAEGSSSRPEAWDPALLFDPDPISVWDTILDDSNAEVSAQVAHGLAFATCLPGDMKQWAGTQSGPVFRHITRGLMMVTDFLNNLHTYFVLLVYHSFKIFYILPYSFYMLLYFLLRLLRVYFPWRQEFSG